MTVERFGAGWLAGWLFCGGGAGGGYATYLTLKRKMDGFSVATNSIVHVL